VKTMKIILVVLPLLTLSMIAFLGCEGAEGPQGPEGPAGSDGLPGPTGSKLSISTMTADRFNIEPGDSTLIYVSVAYTGTEPLTYVWETEAGTVTGADSLAQWNAPMLDGFYWVSVEVSDDNDSATGWVTIGVTTPTGPPGTPPFPPDGVFSITGDGYVEICWNANWESDLAGYGVYRDDNSDWIYDWLTDVDRDVTCYIDDTAQNGNTYHYAITAFNERGQESDLSYEDVFDTPRPQGFGLTLDNYAGAGSATSGYDFSSLANTAIPWNSTVADIYFGTEGGIRYLFTTAGAEIQDWGVIDLEYVDWAPNNGWAPSGRAEAIVGHSYTLVVDGPAGQNFAKVFVANVSDQSVTMDWAYQEVTDLPELISRGRPAK
jgi:hypothetical protein